MIDGVVLGISGWFTPHGELYHEEGRAIDEIAAADWARFSPMPITSASSPVPNRRGLHPTPVSSTSPSHQASDRASWL